MKMLEYTEVKISDLAFNKNNPRINDDAAERLTKGIEKYGFINPVVVNRQGNMILAGHTRVKALKKLGKKTVPVLFVDMDEATARGFAIWDNKSAEFSEWDKDLLDLEIQELVDLDFDIELTGFSLADLGLGEPDPGGLTDDDETPGPPADPISKLGDVWVLDGRHRVMCGDSTDAAQVAVLMDGKKAALCHADPPYGMGKEKDGVQNDNLYRDKLDAFQMQWWKAFRAHLDDNGSAYIWGNAEDLWRLWYRGGLKDSERLTFRNEIAWDKKSAGAGGISHMGAESIRQYPCATERCLFFMLGEQGFNNNADNYWDGWEPIRAQLKADCDKMGWGANDIKRICGVGMYGHWFTESQWTFIPEEHYKKLQKAARDHDAFKRDHEAFKRDHEAFKRDHDDLKREFYATRAYFNNTHDNMTDVWEFQRVTGEDRHGHATPKPVKMIERIMLSSLPENGLCVEPFLGSGSTLIAAEKTNRTCYGMELSEAYTDVCCKRYYDYTGNQAIHAETGEPFPT